MQRLNGHAGVLASEEERMMERRSTPKTRGSIRTDLLTFVIVLLWQERRVHIEASVFGSTYQRSGDEEAK
jgi:hypothetical protein